MKFFNIWYFVIAIIFVAGAYFYSSNQAVMCWDGVEFDEDFLMQECGVGVDEYYEKVHQDETFCPKGEEAFTPIGGCGPDWSLVGGFVAVVFVVYNVIYGVIYLVLKRKKAKA